MAVAAPAPAPGMGYNILGLLSGLMEGISFLTEGSILREMWEEIRQLRWVGVGEIIAF